MSNEDVLKKIDALLAGLNAQNSPAIIKVEGNIEGLIISNNYAEGYDRFLDISGTAKDVVFSANTMVANRKAELIADLKQLRSVIASGKSRSDVTTLAEHIKQKFLEYEPIASFMMELLSFFKT